MARPDGAGRRERRPDDAGGVWIITGVVLGALFYGFIVTMYVAGFTAAAPLVVIPPVLFGLIAANNLLGGGRTYGRTAGRPVGGGQGPLPPSGPDRPGPAEPANGKVPRPGPSAGEPREPR